jgi:hypothetical protein
VGEKNDLAATKWSQNDLVLPSLPQKKTSMVATKWSLATQHQNDLIVTRFLSGEKKKLNCHQVVSK